MSSKKWFLTVVLVLSVLLLVACERPDRSGNTVEVPLEAPAADASAAEEVAPADAPAAEEVAPADAPVTEEPIQVPTAAPPVSNSATTGNATTGNAAERNPDYTGERVFPDMPESTGGVEIPADWWNQYPAGDANCSHPAGAIDVEIYRDGSVTTVSICPASTQGDELPVTCRQGEKLDTGGWVCYYIDVPQIPVQN